MHSIEQKTKCTTLLDINEVLISMQILKLTAHSSLLYKAYEFFVVHECIHPNFICININKLKIYKNIKNDTF